jgi:predicted ester cyclase
MKKICIILPLALLLCFTVGCQDKEAMAELEAMKAQAEVEEQNKEVVRKWFKAFDEGNLEGFMELCAPNFLWYYPPNNPNPWSKEESREQVVMLYKAFPKWNQKIEEIMAIGDKVIARAVATTTHIGEYLGIPATGNKVEYSITVIISLEDGKIVELREEGDALSQMQQLGMELKPKKGK